MDKKPLEDYEENVDLILMTTYALEKGIDLDKASDAAFATMLSTKLLAYARSLER